MRVGIIGGGIAALVTAHQVSAAGAEPVIVDKASRIGGRLARTRLASTVIPTGATGCMWTDDAARQALSATLGVELDAGRSSFEQPVWDALDQLNARVPRHRGLVTRIFPHASGCDLELWGNPDVLPVDAVVITAPVPQAAALLDRSALRHALDADYDPRLVLVAAVDRPVSVTAGDGAWQSVHQHDRVLAAHARAQFSRDHFGEDQTHVHAQLLTALHRSSPGIVVTDSTLKAWRYAEATRTCGVDLTQPVTDAAVWVCGDGYGPAGSDLGVQRAVRSALTVSSALLPRSSEE